MSGGSAAECLGGEAISEEIVATEKQYCRWIVILLACGPKIVFYEKYLSVFFTSYLLR